MASRKPSRRPYASKYRKAQARPRPIGNTGGGQAGFIGPSSSAGGLW